MVRDTINKMKSIKHPTWMESIQNYLKEKVKQLFKLSPCYKDPARRLGRIDNHA